MTSGIRYRSRGLRPALAQTLARALLMIACVVECAAQQEKSALFVGVAGGYESGRLESSFAARVGSPECGTFDDGTMAGTRFGIRADLAGWPVDALGMSLMIDGSTSTRSLTASHVEPLWMVVSGRDSAIGRSFVYDVSAIRFSFGALATLPVTGPLSIGIGPRMSVHASSSAVETERLDPAAGVAFAGEGASRVETNGEPYSAAPLSFDAVGMVRATIGAGPKVRIIAELTGALGLSSEMAGWNERRSAVGASLGVLIDIFARTTSPVEPVMAEAVQHSRPELPAEQPPQVQLTPSRPVIDASIALYGIGADGARSDSARVIVYEQIRRSEVRIAPRIPITPGLGTLPDGCLTLLPGDADTIDERTIIGDRTACRLLDLIGLRMRRAPATRVTLRSISSDARRGEARCAAARDHLTRQWGIDGTRIRCDVQTKQGVVEGIELAGDVGLLAPVITLDTTRTFGTPRVKIEPSYKTAAGLKRWEIGLTHRGATLARYVHQGGTTKEERELASHVDPGLELAASPLVATFVVEDSIGQRTESIGTIGVELLRVPSVVVERINERSETTERVTTVPSAADDETEAKIVEEIAGTVKKGDRITVLRPREARAHDRAPLAERADRIATALAGELRKRGLTQEVARRTVEGDAIEGQVGAVGVRVGK